MWPNKEAQQALLQAVLLGTKGQLHGVAPRVTQDIGVQPQRGEPAEGP